MKTIKNSLTKAILCLFFCTTTNQVMAITNLDLPNWMGHMPGSWPLSYFGIPGTHDSGARYDPPILSNTAKAQDLTISQQLAIGVRFLDIRCRRANNTDLAIYHGPIFQKIWLGSGVIEPVRAFLRAHPSETVIISIKEEYSPSSQVTLPFEQILYSYLRHYPADDRAGKFKGWYTRNAIPSLDQAHGQIILMRRFDHKSKVLRCFSRGCNWVNVTTPVAYRVGGLDAWSSWPNNSSRISSLIGVEDHYDNPGQKTKWGYVYKALKSTINDPRSNKPLSITFTSATTKTHWSPITYYSDYINTLLYGFVRPMASGYGLGIVVMDHVDRNLASEIIDVMTPYRH